MSALELIPSPSAIGERAYLDAHPEISEAAPRWARQIKFKSISADGSSDFHYWFNDDRFELNEHYKYLPGEGVIYGDKQFDSEYDEPEITAKEDALLELITAYVEKEYAPKPAAPVLTVDTWDQRYAPMRDCLRVVAEHPEITEYAPYWAREIAFTDTDDGGEVGFVYQFKDENVTISVGGDIYPDERGLVVEDIPDTVINRDFLDGPICINQRFLLEALRDYITNKGTK